MTTSQATSAADSPLKQCHLEDSGPTGQPIDEPPTIPADPKPAYAHRATLRGRATISNAADNMFDIVKDEIG
ncbi:hypothetical protein FRC10_010369 [Ceratobasidium sp. 414]|nr:hypothetical protein FRC10_010369 [Ceratobasidium sp. 414]